MVIKEPPTNLEAKRERCWRAGWCWRSRAASAEPEESVSLAVPAVQVVLVNLADLEVRVVQVELESPVALAVPAVPVELANLAVPVVLENPVVQVVPASRVVRVELGNPVARAVPANRRWWRRSDRQQERGK